MLTATLGGLIKDYRIKKRLSQFDVSLRIGWKDTSRLSKIEQGRVGKPTRATLDKIFDALELNEHERGEMMLASGILPTKEEVARTIHRIKDVMGDFKYPLMLLDFAWNIFYFNELCRELFKISNQDYKYLEKNIPNWLEMLFLRKSFKNVTIKGGYRENNLQPFEIYQIAHFKFEQKGNTKEKWYKNLLSKLIQNDDFHKLWLNTPASSEDHLYDYEFNEFKGTWRGKERTLKFHIFASHPAFDSRFALLIHQPADEHTHKFYQHRNNYK